MEDVSRRFLPLIFLRKTEVVYTPGRTSFYCSWWTFTVPDNSATNRCFRYPGLYNDIDYQTLKVTTYLGQHHNTSKYTSLWKIQMLSGGCLLCCRFLRSPLLLQILSAYNHQLSSWRYGHNSLYIWKNYRSEWSFYTEGTGEQNSSRVPNRKIDSTRKTLRNQLGERMVLK